MRRFIVEIEDVDPDHTQGRLLDEDRDAATETETKIGDMVKAGIAEVLKHVPYKVSGMAWGESIADAQEMIRRQNERT